MSGLDLNVGLASMQREASSSETHGLLPKESTELTDVDQTSVSVRGRESCLYLSVLWTIVVLGMLAFVAFRPTFGSHLQNQLGQMDLEFEVHTSTANSSLELGHDSETNRSLPALSNNFSLFCFTVATEWEISSLLRWQMKESVSMFACDAFAVYSFTTEPVEMGNLSNGSNGSSFLSTPIPGPKSWTCTYNGVSMLCNTNALLRAWQHVFNDGVAEKYAWIVKVDPDTVLLPHRLVEHLKRNGRTDVPDRGPPGRYFLNCFRYHSMQGPLELLSRQAMLTFRDKYQSCIWQFGENVGEDIFLFYCLRSQGAWQLQDFSLLRDGKCNGLFYDGRALFDCRDTSIAAFHPFKDIASYASCFGEAYEAEGVNTSLRLH